MCCASNMGIGWTRYTARRARFSPFVRCIALLHSVVLPGGERLRMADLIAVAQALGLSRATTFGSTGNLLFETEPKTLSGLQDALEDAFFDRFGKRIAFVLRPAEAFLALAGRSPFDAGHDPQNIAVRVMREPYAQDFADRLLPYADGAKLAVVDGDLWIGFPEKPTGSRLLSRIAGGKAATVGTFRTLAMIQRISAQLESEA